jgi:hypothetical protein
MKIGDRSASINSLQNSRNGEISSDNSKTSDRSASINSVRDSRIGKISSDNPVEWQIPVWEQQPGEPNLLYDRFSRFLLMGPKRSLLGMYQAEGVRRGTKGYDENREKIESVKRPTTAPRSWRAARDEWQWHN